VKYLDNIPGLTDTQIALALYMAMGVLVVLAFLANVRGRRNVRWNGRRRFTRFNPYNHLKLCAPMTDAERQAYRRPRMPGATASWWPLG
jgi:hypothetical protein